MPIITMLSQDSFLHPDSIIFDDIRRHLTILDEPKAEPGYPQAGIPEALAVKICGAAMDVSVPADDSSTALKEVPPELSNMTMPQ